MSSKEIQVKDAKCRGLSLQVPVNFAKAEGRPESDFVMEAYTGQVVERWWGKLAIDISGIKAKKAIPIFRDHERGNIVGYSSDTWKDGSFFVSGKFSSATAHATEVKALAKEGFPWQASIGVMPLKILSLEDKASHEVNGKTLKGPAEVWLESEVFETSFVPLGADGNTSVSVFSRFEETAKPTAGDDPPERKDDMAEDKKVPVVLTLESLRADHPELVSQLLTEGADLERARIKAIAALAMAGHEDLIERLMYDGKTSGPEAAVAILQAEKKVRAQVVENLAADSPAPVAHVVTPEVVAPAKEDESLSIDERAKATWDKDSALRSEYGGDYDAYLSFRKAEDQGLVKILGGKTK
jgi:hypothetical protein